LIIDVATDLGGPFPAAPCNKGYVMAFVEDAAHHAISANQLIGSYRISGTDGDDAEAVNAIAVQSAKPEGTLLGSPDPATGEVVLTFGTAATSDYVALPDVQFSDFQAVNPAAVPKRTQLIVLTPTIKAGLANPQASVGIRAWNQFADESSSTRQFTCWAEFELETVAGFFNAATLGTPFGSTRFEPVATATYDPAILGVIRETGPGPTVRRMYHTDTVVPSSTFGPAPMSTTAPPSTPPPPPPPPTVTVIATGCTTCHSGGVVAYNMAFNNLGPTMKAEVKGGARFPDGSILPLVNTVTTIPSGASTLTLVPSQALPAGLPTIDLVVEAVILEPSLGATLNRHSVTLHLLP
jgi:hypothetical protein